MESFKAGLVEVCERGYTTLEDFADPANSPFFRTFELPFEQHDGAELTCRTQTDFLHEVLQAHDCKAALTGNENSNWKAILNYAVETLDEADRGKGLAKFSITSHFTIETMIQSWLGRLRCFFDRSIGQWCSLIGLHQISTERPRSRYYMVISWSLGWIFLRNADTATSTIKKRPDQASPYF